MKGLVFLIIFLAAINLSSTAQQRIEPGGMSYVVAPKLNNIIYHDTLYRGSAQFKSLFYRSRNPDLIYYYQKHQSNKVAGQVVGMAGTVATLIGISMVFSGGTNKGPGWVWLGGGFATTLMGGYLTFMGQRNLQTAVTLFNRQNHSSSLGIGVADRNVGLVFKF